MPPPRPSLCSIAALTMTMTSTSICKNERNEGIAKRRTIPVAPLSAMPAAMGSDSITINDKASPSDNTVESKTVYTVADIPSLNAKLPQPNIDDVTHLEVVCGFHKILGKIC